MLPTSNQNEVTMEDNNTCRGCAHTEFLKEVESYSREELMETLKDFVLETDRLDDLNCEQEGIIKGLTNTIILLTNMINDIKSPV